MVGNQDNVDDVKCSLCNSENIYLFFEKKKFKWGSRNYYHCKDCDFVFVPSKFHLSESEEIKIYNQHENSIENEGYVKFLSPVAEAISEYFDLGTEGLDYGSGPHPVLVTLLNERGFKISHFDPLFFPDQDAIKRKYQFVTCTEVIEHFCKPRKEFKRLKSLLKENGILALKTQLRSNLSFENWWYHRDPTHISFYSSNCIKWLAKFWNLKELRISTELILLQNYDGNKLKLK